MEKYVFIKVKHNTSLHNINAHTHVIRDVMRSEPYLTLSRVANMRVFVENRTNGLESTFTYGSHRISIINPKRLKDRPYPIEIVDEIKEMKGTIYLVHDNDTDLYVLDKVEIVSFSELLKRLNLKIDFLKI